MRLLACLLALLAFTSAHAQGTVAGTIRDADTGETVPGASVIIDGTTLGAATNAHGSFAIRGVPAGPHRVSVTFIGYERGAFTVEVRDRETSRFDPSLVPGPVCSVRLDGGPYGYNPLVPRSAYPSRVAIFRPRYAVCRNECCDEVATVMSPWPETHSGER